MKFDNDITVILADGEFPSHPIPRGILTSCKRVVCCDGAVHKLLDSRLRTPDVIVGDLDSSAPHLLKGYEDRIVRIDSQDTNDLTKAFDYCREHGYTNIAILGATGLREDHTLGNISLLVSYSEHANVTMYSNYGVFDAVERTSTFDSTPGQQISIFSLTPSTPISYEGLKWNISNRPLLSWWEGTLNEATGSSFKVVFDGGKVIVFRQY